MPRRCLVLVTTTSYRTDAFLSAGRALGAEMVIGSDRCHQLAELWPDEAFRGAFEASWALDFRDPAQAAAQIVAAAAAQPLDAIVGTDELTAHVAAIAARALGLGGNDPEATLAARNKSTMRARLAAASVPSPTAIGFDAEEDPARISAAVVASIGFPCVVKPLLLSSSRGVIRADDEAALVAALARVVKILRSRAAWSDGRDPDARRILVENFIPGAEVALEGIVARGRLRTLAIYDKPDPLDGPFFEETIYVTPSRHPAALQARIEDTAAAAARALGLSDGPIHAELRLGPAGPVVIEVAARSIGGLCARTLRFALGGDDGHALEELVLRHALGLPVESWVREGSAAGVMMLPVPRAGVLKEVHGVDEAKQVPLIEDVLLSVRVGEMLVPLPEGASYPGFIFARGADPLSVENALRAAHARLRFDIAPVISEARPAV